MLIIHPNAQSGGLRCLNEVLSNQQVSCCDGGGMRRCYIYYSSTHTHTHTVVYIFIHLHTYKKPGFHFFFFGVVEINLNS